MSIVLTVVHLTYTTAKTELEIMFLRLDSYLFNIVWL